MLSHVKEIQLKSEPSKQQMPKIKETNYGNQLDKLTTSHTHTHMRVNWPFMLLDRRFYNSPVN